MRPRLVPIAGTTDEALLEPFYGVIGSESRSWLWGWAREQVAERAPRESLGAIRVLAALSSKDGAHRQDFFRAIDETPTAYLSVLVESLWHGERFRRAPDPGRREWLQGLRVRVVTRPDSVLSAPDVVASVMWDAAMQDGPLRRRTGSRRHSHTQPAMDATASIVATLERMFDVPTRESFASVEIFVPRLSSFGREESKRISKSSDHRLGGLGDFLGKVWRAAQEPSVAHANSVLQMMDETWTSSDWMPAELKRGIPIPVNRLRLSPAEMRTRITALSDEELTQALSDRRIDLVSLADAGGHVPWFRRIDMSKQADIVTVARRAPRTAWILWCYALDTTQHGRAVSPAAQSVVADVLVADSRIWYSS